MKYYRLNNKINTPKIRLIDENGKHLGIIEIAKALQMAQEKKLDLVEISPKANPPVAKITDFSQFKYKLRKDEKKQKIKRKVGVIKGIRLTPRMAEHDLNLKVKKAKQFLEEGKKIKIDMVLRGREKAHFDLAQNIINQFINLLEPDIIIEQPIKRQGGRISCLINKK